MNISMENCKGKKKKKIAREYVNTTYLYKPRTHLCILYIQIFLSIYYLFHATGNLPLKIMTF